MRWVSMPEKPIVRKDDNKSPDPFWGPGFLVREMGLEPTRRNHTHLKRACLPFQHSRNCLYIISVSWFFVNMFFWNLPEGTGFGTVDSRSIHVVKWGKQEETPWNIFLLHCRRLCLAGMK